MEKEVSEALQNLRKSKEEKGDSARLRESLQEIEATLAGGVSLKSIHAALLSCGFTFTFGSFKQALQRARKRREGSKPLANQAGPAQASTAPARPQNLPPVSSPPPSVGGSSSVPVEPIILEMREELRVFKDSIKHLPDRERRQKLSDFQEKQDERLKIHRMVNKTK